MNISIFTSHSTLFPGIFIPWSRDMPRYADGAEAFDLLLVIFSIGRGEANSVVLCEGIG